MVSCIIMIDCLEIKTVTRLFFFVCFFYVTRCSRRPSVPRGNKGYNIVMLRVETLFNILTSELLGHQRPRTGGSQGLECELAPFRRHQREEQDLCLCPCCPLKPRCGGKSEGRKYVNRKHVNRAAQIANITKVRA